MTEQGKENNKIRKNRTSSLRKWISMKRKGNDKNKVLQNLFEKQEELENKIHSFDDNRLTVLNELASTNQSIKVLDDKISNLADNGASRKDCENEAKQQLKQERQTNNYKSEEIKRLTEEKHRLELELCKLDVELQQIKSELIQTNKQRENALESLSTVNESSRELRDQYMDLKLELQEKETSIRELKVDNQLLKDQVETLKMEANETEKNIRQVQKERYALIEQLKDNAEKYQGRMKACWVEICSLKQEKSQITGEKSDSNIPVLNNGAYRHVTSNITDWEKNNQIEHQKTKILQQEFQLYRREKLVEILVYKLRNYEPSFSLFLEPGLIGYLDENWSSTEQFKSSDRSSCSATSTSAESQLSGLSEYLSPSTGTLTCSDIDSTE